MSPDPASRPLGGLAVELYEHLLAARPATVDELARSSGRETGTVHRAVDQLADLGLVDRRTDGTLSVPPPRTSVDGVVQQMEDSAEWLRQRAADWQRAWREQGDTTSYIDVLTDEEEMDAVDVGLVENVRHQVRGLQVGPVEPRGGPRREPQIHPAFESVIARGVAFRVVYGVSVVSDPVALALVHESIALGEQARVFPEVPLRVTICDDAYAVVTVPGRGEQVRHKVVVRASGLLDSLIDLFECFWRMAVPLVPQGSGDDWDLADDTSRRLLAYLGAGLTDASIARELGVSERTVGRRVARLQERVGARTRFQLAAQASRRGWL